MKYRVKKACDWKSFGVKPTAGKELVLDAADLTTADGVPLPADVVAEMVKAECLEPVGE